MHLVNNMPSTSSSALKLNSYSEISESGSSNSKSDMPYMAFVNINMWDTLLRNMKCSECDNHCGSNFTSPCVPEQKMFEVNKKIVEAFLKISKGHEAIEIFPLVLGIQSMDKKTFFKLLKLFVRRWQRCEKEVLEIASTVVRKKAEEIDPSPKNILDITVYMMERGHTSLYGIGIVIDISTGLVIHYVVLSKYYPECTVAP